MPEQHTGTKFHTEFLLSEASLRPGSVADLLRAELVHWCRVFDRLGLSPDYGKGSCGNLSYRVEDGFVITPTGAYFSSLDEEDLVKVVACDLAGRRVMVIGKREPSSEAMLHYEVYRRRPEVMAVFHGHDEGVVSHARELRIAETVREQPYGSIELMQEVAGILGDQRCLVLKNHGFLSLGGSMKEAGELALDMRAAVLKLA